MVHGRVIYKHFRDLVPKHQDKNKSCFFNSDYTILKKCFNIPFNSFFPFSSFLLVLKNKYNHKYAGS